MRMCNGLPLGHVEVNSYYYHHHFTLYVHYCFRKARTMSFYFTVSSSITNNVVISYGFSIWLIQLFFNSLLQLFSLQLSVFLSESLWPPVTHTRNSWLLIFFNFFSVGLKNICQLTAGQKFPSLQWVIDKFSSITCINNCIAKWRLSAWDIWELPLLAASA